jgi:hypothetical protein
MAFFPAFPPAAIVGAAIVGAAIVGAATAVNPAPPSASKDIRRETVTAAWRVMLAKVLSFMSSSSMIESAESVPTNGTTYRCGRTARLGAAMPDAGQRRGTIVVLETGGAGESLPAKRPDAEDDAAETAAAGVAALGIDFRIALGPWPLAGGRRIARPGQALAGIATRRIVRHRAAAAIADTLLAHRQPI